jgi:hypothetical protein
MLPLAPTAQQCQAPWLEQAKGDQSLRQKGLGTKVSGTSQVIEFTE